MWFQCTECTFATNSPRQSTRHTELVGHTLYTEEDLV